MIQPSKSPWACGVLMAKKKGDQLRFCCEFRYLNSVTVRMPIPYLGLIRASKIRGCKLFLQQSISVRFFGRSTEEAGQGQNRFCLRATAVSVEEDAFWPWQRHGYVSTIDGTRIDKCNEETCQPGDVLRGRHGNSDTYSRGPHRATG